MKRLRKSLFAHNRICLRASSFFLFSLNRCFVELTYVYKCQVIVKMATKNKGLRLPVVFIDQAREHTPALDQLLRAGALQNPTAMVIADGCHQNHGTVNCVHE